MDLPSILLTENLSISLFEEAYDPYVFFGEYADCNPVRMYLEDTAGGVAKKGIIHKLIDLIVKGINAIVSTFQKVIKWIKTKLFGKKSPRTVDQVLNDLGLKRSEEAKNPNRTVPWDEANSDPSVIQQHIETMMKPALIEFEADGETVIITPWKYIKNKITGHSGEVNNDHKSLYDPRAFMVAMKFISNPEMMKELEITANNIQSANVSYNAYERIDNLFSRAITDLNISLKYKITMKQIAEFNQRLLEIQKVLQSMDDTRNPINDDNEKTVKALNRLCTGVLNLQIGATMLGTAMSRVYVIDPEYCETIRDVTILDKFVNEMLNAGIPDKYIAFNAWMASDINIKGNENVDKPRWGMSRVTFLPPDETLVYKIAINGWGIRSNNSEKEISDAVYAANVGERFAKILACGENKCVVTMERAVMDKSKAKPLVNQVKAAMNEAIHKAGIPGKVGDVSANNVGFRGDLAISIDYGMINRTPGEAKPSDAGGAAPEAAPAASAV